jgi:hypothetical protein
MQAALPPQPSAFERQILAGESASAVLGKWCERRGLPTLRARRDATAKVANPPGAPNSLLARPGERVAWRHVVLACGAQTLSRADNWYLPDRLTDEMNRRLETTQEPFGLVVRPLAFTRHILASRRSPSGALEVTAVLLSRAGVPFSYVIERYDPALR